MKSIIILVICLKILKVASQENAGTNVAPALIECYNKSANLHRDNRPETTMIQLIELITKIESSSSLQNDRELSKEIIHRFKQDGISKQKDVLGSKYTIPYSPMDYQANKNRLLLKVLVPGSAVLFPNETLNELERCSLHFMLSTSIDTTKRDDEAITCKGFAKYVRRIRSAVDPKHEIETFEPERARATKRNAVESVEDFAKDVISDNTSECPIENGVAYTKWGAVASGTVIAGIAAGRSQQDIVDRGRTINNIYASTLAGDLAEVALQQGSRGKDPVVVGASGGWNAIEIPRAFYLEENEKGTNYEMTDAEIRGGLDGLIIGLNMKEWHSKVPSLKISQVLDMYYSPRGVFSKKYRACNRNKLFTEVAPLDKLKEQAVGFSFMLSEKAVLPGTISEEGIEAHSKKAADVLLDYTANKLSDISCAVDDGSIERISTDIIIAIDSGWDYSIIYKILSYLLQNLDVNNYDSKYIIINGKDGSPIVETTNFIGDISTKFTKERHYMSPKGSDVDKVLEVAESMIKVRMVKDKENKKAGGASYILLFIKYESLSDQDRLRIDSRKSNIRSLLPDIKILALGRGSKDAYSELVLNPTYDCFGLSDNAIMESVKPVIERIRQTPRRITNPNCGSNWEGETSSSEAFDQYVEPYGINFYRVASNYLFGEGTKTIKVKGYGYGNLLACTSRVNSRPLNATQDSVQCETITANQEVAFKFDNPCSGYTIPMDCAPAFFSVQAQVTGSESTIFRCTDLYCRFPDNIKYSIAVDGLECESCAHTIISNNKFLLAILLVVLKLSS